MVVETELLVAVIAATSFERSTIGAGLGGVGGCSWSVVEGDDGGIAQAGTFAEGSWCWAEC